MSTPKPLPGKPKTTLPAVLKKDLEARNLSLNSHEDLLKEKWRKIKLNGKKFIL